MENGNSENNKGSSLRKEVGNELMENKTNKEGGREEHKILKNRICLKYALMRLKYFSQQPKHDDEWIQLI